MWLHECIGGLLYIVSSIIGWRASFEAFENKNNADEYTDQQRFKTISFVFFLGAGWRLAAELLLLISVGLFFLVATALPAVLLPANAGGGGCVARRVSGLDRRGLLGW